MAYNIVSFVFILNVIKISISVPASTEEAFQEAHLVPDVLEDAPELMLMVTYPSGVVVDFNQLTPTQVKGEPVAEWFDHPDRFYTLCMFDADHPSTFNPSLREWLHWLVVNIPGDDIKKGDTLAELIEPFPEKGTGMHRYVFLLYEQQPHRIKFYGPRLNNKSMFGREKFNISEFAANCHMGLPIHGNYFKAQWDEYASKVRASLDDTTGQAFKAFSV